MARPSSNAQQRQLTLTEELEKLEQSITLTLQEIDHNFSRAHRIVTSSILPIVEQYASHSKEVWEGSKFWKQFFESSANVSLSGYEEQSMDHNNADETVTEDSNTTTHETLETSESYETPSAQHISTDSIQDLDLSNMTISPSKSSTPRPSFKQKDATQVDQTASLADYPSPYEALRQEVHNNRTTHNDTPSLTQDGPSTPGRAAEFAPRQDTSTPQSSPFLAAQPHQPSVVRPSTARKQTDPLLHRILDRNYRIQATPLTNNKTKRLPMATPATAQKTRHLFDSTMSSSPVAPPELHEELFSPAKRSQRTPGVSVLTPARGRNTKGATASHETPQGKSTVNIWEDSDDELDDSDMGFTGSPPKTIQFHVPQNRLLKTPAKEASRRIVSDIMHTAGVGNEEEEDDIELDLDLDPETELSIAEGRYQPDAYDDSSPSVVRKVVGLEDETF